MNNLAAAQSTSRKMSKWVWIVRQVETLPAGISNDTYPLHERLLCSSSEEGSCLSSHHDR